MSLSFHWVSPMTFLPSASLLIAIKASLILALVSLLYLLIGRRRPQACTLCQRAGLTALLLLPLGAFWLPTIALPVLAPEPRVASNEIAFPLSLDLLPLPSPGPATTKDGLSPLPTPANVTAVVRLRSSSVPTAERKEPRRSNMITPLALFVAGWGLVAGLLVFRIARSWLGLRRLEQTGTPVVNREWRSELECWSSRLGIRRSVQLRMSNQVSVAMTFGWRAPVILIPNDYLTSCDAQQREAVIIHELTHVAHNDFPWHLLTELTACLYWPHPLMWIIRWQGGVLRERLCDAFCLLHLTRRSYGEALVRIAGRMTVRPAVSLGMSMAQRSSLRRRLTDLTNCTPERCVAPSQIQRITLVATAGAIFGLIVVASLTSRADDRGGESSSPKKTADVNESDKNPPAAKMNAASRSLPAALHGKVIDHQNNPVAKAEVIARLRRSNNGNQESGSKLPDKWTVTTDDQGAFTIPTGIQPISADGNLELKIKSENHPDLSAWISPEQLGGAKLPTQQLREGRTIRGRFVDPQGHHVPDVVLRISAGKIASQIVWFSDRIPAGKLGTFSIVIPKEAQACAAVYPPGFAPRFLELPNDVTDLGPIPVESGTSVTGRVLDRQGQGVAGTVVAFENTEYRIVDALSTLIAMAVKTDESGNFTLPPVRGRYRLRVTKSAPDYSRQTSIDGVEPPPIASQTLAIDGTGKMTEVILREAESARIRGTVRQADGSPMANVLVYAKTAPAGRDKSYDMAETRTDEKGRYAIRLPTPLEHVVLSTQHQRMADGTWQQAKALGRGANRDKAYASMELDRFTRDVEGADWVFDGMREVERQNLNVFDSPRDRELEELGQREQAANPKYMEALQKATTPEEQMEVLNTLDPRNLFVSDYLAFEEKYRGTTAAVCAMRHVMLGAASVGLPELPVSRARVTLVDVIIEHYLNHQDVDLLLGTFIGGPPVPKAEELLRRAEKSQQPHVRAAALWEGADHQARRCQAATTMTLFQQLNADTPQFRMLSERFAHVKKLYGEMDADASRKKALELLERLLNEHPETQVPYRVFDGPQMLSFKLQTPAKNEVQTYASRARDLRFRLTELRVGHPVPELTGKSVQGEEISSRSAPGRVTVLLFSSAHDGRSAALREELKKLMQDHPDEISVVEVYAGQNEKEAQEFAAGNDRWPIIPETYPNGPLFVKWTGQRSPFVIVVDKEGNLRSDSDLPLMFLGPCIQSVLKKTPDRK